MPGLGLLDTTTEMLDDKITKQVEFTFNETTCKGYEIHQGITTYCNGSGRDGEKADTIVYGNHCIGTYVHGILDNQPIIEYLIAPFEKGRQSKHEETIDEFKDRQYNLLADHVRQHVDIEQLIKIMTE